MGKSMIRRKCVVSSPIRPAPCVDFTKIKPHFQSFQQNDTQDTQDTYNYDSFIQILFTQPCKNTISYLKFQLFALFSFDREGRHVARFFCKQCQNHSELSSPNSINQGFDWTRCFRSRRNGKIPYRRADTE